MASAEFLSNKPMNKRDILAIIALTVAFLGMFWAALPFSLPQEEKKVVSESVVDIAKSMVEAAKGNKSQAHPPPTKTFLEKVAENSFRCSLAIAASSFVLSIIMYIMGAKRRLFKATMAVNITTVALNALWVALIFILIFAAIEFIESVGIDFFN